MSGTTPTVILDCGAHHLRAGYAGEEGPRLDIPTLVGYPRHRGVAMAAGMNEIEVGEEAVVKQGMLTVRSPIHNGLVEAWDDMENLWSHLIFSELRVSPENHCFLLTDAINTPAAQKERTLELMMETFHAHSLFLGVSQVLSLYAYGLTTGLVVDSGKDRTLAVPVHEGYALGRHVTQSTVAGETLTNYLHGLLRQEGYSLGTPVEQLLLNEAKENCGLVRRSAYQDSNINVLSATGNARIASSGGLRGGMDAPFLGTNGDHANASELHGDGEGDIDVDYLLHAGTETFELPDGQAIPLSAEQRVATTDVLFDFSLLGDDERYEPRSKVLTVMGEVFTPSFRKGISWLPFASINLCENALRPQLYKNIVVAGNSLSFPGARARLESEIIQLYRENHSNEAVTPIKVHDVGCRGYTAFLGAAMLARTSLFPHLVVSRQAYEEEGARVVHSKSL